MRMTYINGYSYISSYGEDGIGELAGALGVSEFRPAVALTGKERRRLRRVGSFHASAAKAAAGTGVSVLDSKRLEGTMVVLTSTFGDQNTTSDFIDDLLDYGRDQCSPIKFAHSNHNTAAAYIAKILNAKGNNITAVNFHGVFANGLTLVQAQLDLNTCEDALLIHVESKSRLTEILRKGLRGEDPDRVETKTGEDDLCEASCLWLSSVRDEKNLAVLRSPPVEEGHFEALAQSTAPLDTLVDQPLSVVSALLLNDQVPRRLESELCFIVEKIQ